MYPVNPGRSSTSGAFCVQQRDRSVSEAIESEGAAVLEMVETGSTVLGAESLFSWSYICATRVKALRRRGVSEEVAGGVRSTEPSKSSYRDDRYQSRYDVYLGRPHMQNESSITDITAVVSIRDLRNQQSLERQDRSGCDVRACLLLVSRAVPSDAGAGGYNCKCSMTRGTNSSRMCCLRIYCMHTSTIEECCHVHNLAYHYYVGTLFVREERPVLAAGS